jgi:hypothetical protein
MIITVTTDIAMIGAGPAGLPITAHLPRRGDDCFMMGSPMTYTSRAVESADSETRLLGSFLKTSLMDLR